MLDKLLRNIPVVAISLAVTQPLLVQADEQAEFSPEKSELAATPILSKVAHFMDLGFINFRTPDVAEATASSIEEKKANGNLGAKQPSRFENRSYQFFLEGEFLYWIATQDGLEYAVKSSSPSTSDHTLLDGKMKDIDFEWGPGCRFTMGYHTPYDFWDVSATWTHFHNHSSADAKAGDGGLSAIWLLFGSDLATPPGFNVSSADARWHLAYDTLDLFVSRNYFVSRAITLTPKVGIRNAWIDQLAKFHYTPLPVATMGSESVRLKNNCYAVGAVMGLDLSFYFARQWSLWGKLAGSLLYGFYSIKEKAVVHGLNTADNPVFYRLKDETQQLVANLETGIGLQWDTDFSHNKRHFALFAGYEFLLWFSQNQLKNFAYPGIDNGVYFESKGDLSLMGLTVGARFDF